MMCKSCDNSATTIDGHCDSCDYANFLVYVHSLAGHDRACALERQDSDDSAYLWALSEIEKHDRQVADFNNGLLN